MVGAVEVPTRVVRVISRMCISGVPQHVVVLAAGLVPPRYETIVLTGSVPGAEGDMTYYATAHGVEPRYIPAMSREVSVLDDLRALWAMYREIRRLRPTIVHTHTAKAGFLGRVAAWMAGVPVIVHTYHGHVLRGYFGPLKTALYRTLERLCAHLSTCLLTVSEAVREDLLSLGVGRPSQMRVVPLGLELRRFAEVPPGGGCLRRELGLRPEVPLIGYCGRLVPIKNLSLYLRAVARLAARRPDLHAVVIGDGELRAALEAEAAALDLGQVVHFLGWRQDTPALYRDLDLMVLTSRNEGTPVAVIEAAAAGVPAVATRVGGVAEVVEDGCTGWLVPSDDEEAVVGAVDSALSDPGERMARGRRAQAAVLERYDAERLVRDVDLLYRELLGRGAG